MEKYYDKPNSKILSNKDVSSSEKLLLIVLISYWRMIKYKYNNQGYIQKSYYDYCDMIGISKKDMIYQYINHFKELGFIKILNEEEVKKSHHKPQIILNEEKINVFFKGEIFQQPKEEKQPKEKERKKETVGTPRNVSGMTAQEMDKLAYNEGMAYIQEIINKREKLRRDRDEQERGA